MKIKYNNNIKQFNKPKPQQSRAIGTTGPHSGSWLRALPNNKNHQKFTSAEFQTACLYRLGLAMPFIAPEQKCDCAKNVTIGTDGGHLNTCHKGNEIKN